MALHGRFFLKLTNMGLTCFDRYVYGKHKHVNTVYMYIICTYLYIYIYICIHARVCIYTIVPRDIHKVTEPQTVSAREDLAISAPSMTLMQSISPSLRVSRLVS